jgi:hypothetical protein
VVSTVPCSGVVFLLVFVFSYSEQIVGGLFGAIGKAESEAWRTVIIAVDLAILAVAGLLKRAVGRSDGGSSPLWRWWWTGFGTTVAVAVDVALSAMGRVPVGSTQPRRARTSSGSPSRSRRGHHGRLLRGTVFDDVFDIDVIRTLDPQTAAKVDQLSLADQQEVLWQICRNAVSPGFFRARGAGDSVGADHARDRVRFLPPDVARTRSAGRDRRHGDDDVDRAGFRTLDPALQGWGAVRCCTPGTST